MQRRISYELPKLMNKLSFLVNVSLYRSHVEPAARVKSAPALYFGHFHRVHTSNGETMNSCESIPMWWVCDKHWKKDTWRITLVVDNIAGFKRSFESERRKLLLLLFFECDFNGGESSDVYALYRRYYTVGLYFSRIVVSEVLKVEKWVNFLPLKVLKNNCILLLRDDESKARGCLIIYGKLISYYSVWTFTELIRWSTKITSILN